MDIAVVIPLFNGEEWVGETLDAVRAQTLPPTEVVVVDDGSTDSSRSVVNGYSNVRLLESPGNGPNAARNYGFRETDAEIVAFLDHDDLWHPEHLQRLFRILGKNPESPAVFASKTQIRGKERPQYSIEAHGSKHHDPWEEFPSNSLGEPFLALIRRSALESVGGWSTQHDGCADYHLWLKLSLEGPLVVSEGVTAAYRVCESSYSNRLRNQAAVNYYARRVEASRDALAFRRVRGLDVERYWPRMEAQEALLDLLEGFVEDKLPKQQEAVRRVDRVMSEQPQKALILVWQNFEWYMRPYVQRVGAQRHALTLLNLLDTLPNTRSQFGEILRKWALERTPAKDLLRRYPWSPICWRYALKRVYRKTRRTIISTR